MKLWRALIICAAVILGVWLFLEIGLRIFVESPLKTDFYSSIAREEVSLMQRETGLKLVQGAGWAHLGWIADPDNEVYSIEKYNGVGWLPVGQARFGSYLVHAAGGRYRVRALPAAGGEAKLIGQVEVAAIKALASPVYRPVISGKWQTLFKPQTYGYYINDHAVYRDAEGNWRLAGITHKSDGNYNEEKYFAVGVSSDLPPASGMKEEKPVADFAELAWAPHVISENGTYYMFWSPHRLERMVSQDGITWSGRETVIPAPYHKFFRDGMVTRVADGQWLLYTTAKDAFFSQVDIYQSFDLRKWQYISTALRSDWGSERNSPFASTESPFVIQYKGRYYLSITYNNDTFFWNGLLLPFKVWLDRPSYNDTLIFQSDNPYDFGVYRGQGNSPSLVTHLAAHGPEYIYPAGKDTWYITTAGWPWVSTITSGEAAIAPLEWQPVNHQQ
jgi:hypothetical protein